jgi:hypothetical protein
VSESRLDSITSPSHAASSLEGELAGRSTVTIAAVSLETELQELMTRVAETDQELAQRLADAVRYDPDAEIDGVTKGVLTTVDLLRIRGRLDALREAVLRLARELDARS